MASKKWQARNGEQEMASKSSDKWVSLCTIKRRSKLYTWVVIRTYLVWILVMIIRNNCVSFIHGFVSNDHITFLSSKKYHWVWKRVRCPNGGGGVHQNPSHTTSGGSRLNRAAWCHFCTWQSGYSMERLRVITIGIVHFGTITVFNAELLLHSGFKWYEIDAFIL